MRRIPGILFLVLLAWAGPAWAEVTIHFYSREFGASFPHAFVRLTGSVESTGGPIDANFGFTAARISPAILFGPVSGEIISAKPAYIARSDRHFSLKLSDEQYGDVLEVVERWRNLPQPSYRLNNRNCVHFVADVASALGLDAAPDPKLMKKPRSFLRKILRVNSERIASWRSGTVAAAR